MTLQIWHITRGLESRFSLAAPLWFYRSKYEPWFIIRLFGIYWWFHLKGHRF
jgi:hypothetical protein